MILDFDIAFITNEAGERQLAYKKVFKVEVPPYGESVVDTGWQPIPQGEMISQEEAEKRAAAQQQPPTPNDEAPEEVQETEN